MKMTRDIEQHWKDIEGWCEKVSPNQIGKFWLNIKNIKYKKLLWTPRRLLGTSQGIHSLKMSFLATLFCTHAHDCTCTFIFLEKNGFNL
jgi:hypothetical protein